MKKERDASNFDFRVVSLMTIAATRADLLEEYLNDGKAKDARGVPDALRDDTKWRHFRQFGFPPEMLAELLYIFERPDVRKALITVQTAFQTSVANDNYCEAGCPDDDYYGSAVPYSAQLTQPLDEPGVQVEV